MAIDWDALKQQVVENMDRLGAYYMAQREYRSARAMGAEVCPLSEHVDFLHARLSHPSWPDGLGCPGCGSAV